MSEFSLFFETDRGQALLEQQKRRLDRMVAKTVGYNCLQLSVSRTESLCGATAFGHYIKLGYAPSLDPLQRDHAWVEYEKLPIASDCADTVILHHVLEFSSAPHELLREVDRILTDSGHLFIVSFRPWSSWELYKHYLLLRDQLNAAALGSCHPVSPNRLGDWLRLLNYEVLDQHSSFSPSRFTGSGKDFPSGRYRRRAVPWLQSILAPLGTYYIFKARKKTHALSGPNRLWKVPKRAHASLARRNLQSDLAGCQKEYHNQQGDK